MRDVTDSINCPFYLSGWDRDSIYADSSFLIHHPQGDVKKLSIDFDPPEYEEQDFLIEFDIGSFESHSSGAPLFNSSFSVFGLANRFYETPSCEHRTCRFTKISDIWDGSNSTNCLKSWLDPENTNVTFLPGYNPFYSDVKIFHSGWNWVSFPRLNRNQNDEQSSLDVLDSIKERMDVIEHRKGCPPPQRYLLRWNYTIQDWQGNLNCVESTRGYKIAMGEQAFLPICGEIVSSNTNIEICENTENWIGCFLPKSSSFSDALSVEVLSHLNYVLAEN